MLYLALFFMCLGADYARKKSKNIYYFLVVVIIVVLCFGYMTGTDWRNYEHVWDGTDSIATTHIGNDYTFLFIMKGFQMLTTDFWVFFAALKIFFLHSLYKFFQCFVGRPWLAIGLSFTGSTLFLIVECPLRFMLGLAFVFYAIYAFYHTQKVLAIILSLLGVGCHMIVLAVIIIWLTKPVARYFCRMHSLILIALFFVVIILTDKASSYIAVLDFVAQSEEFGKYTTSYGGFSTGGYMNLGTLTRLFYLLMALSLKKIIKQKYDKIGDEIIYFCCLNAYLGIFLGGIPTGFRLNTLNSYYNIILLQFFLSFTFVYKDIYKIKIIGVMKIATCILVCVLILRGTDYSFYKPYSNSIPYILTEHLPYAYRDSYNEKHFNE